MRTVKFSVLYLLKKKLVWNGNVDCVRESELTRSHEDIPTARIAVNPDDLHPLLMHLDLSGRPFFGPLVDQV